MLNVQTGELGMCLMSQLAQFLDVDALLIIPARKCVPLTSQVNALIFSHYTHQRYRMIVIPDFTNTQKQKSENVRLRRNPARFTVRGEAEGVPATT